MDNSPQLCDPRPHAHRRDEPPRFRPLPRRLRVLRRGAVHAVVRVLAVRDPARVASRLARRRRAGPSAFVARRDRGAFAHQRGRHGGEEDGARGDAQGGAREGCRAGGGGGDGGGARVRAREQLIVRSYVIRSNRAVALSNAVAFARFGREKKSALLLSSWYRARGGSGQYRSFRIERKARREEKRGRAATIRGVEKTVCVAHVSRSRFRLVVLLDDVRRSPRRSRYRLDSLRATLCPTLARGRLLSARVLAERGFSRARPRRSSSRRSRVPRVSRISKSRRLDSARDREEDSACAKKRERVSFRRLVITTWVCSRAGRFPIRSLGRAR